jgi:hypothetical protein
MNNNSISVSVQSFSLIKPSGACRRVAAQEFSPACQGRVTDSTTIVRRAATAESIGTFSQLSRRYATNSFFHD